MTPVYTAPDHQTQQAGIPTGYSSNGSIAIIAAGWVLTALLALAVYQPWHNHGFDIEDFSEFRPLLESSQRFGTRFEALSDYYRDHGRWNVAAYVALAAKWTWLADNAVAWQWLRFGQMFILAALVLWVLKRLHFAPVPVALGAPLLLFSSPAAAAFTRLTLSEPLGAMAGVVALALATAYQNASRWLALAVGISLTSVVMIAAKEMLVVCALPIGIMALAWDGNRWRRPRWSDRNQALVVVMMLSVVAVSLPVVLTARSAGAVAYSSGYGASRLHIVDIVYLLQQMLVSTHAVLPAPPSMLLFPGNLVLIAIVGAAWLRPGNAGIGSQYRGLLACCLLIAIAASAMYLPWPRFEAFYALPIYIGTVIAATGAVDLAARRDRRTGNMAILLALISVAFLAIGAFQHSQMRLARRALNTAVVGTLAQERRLALVIVETPSGSNSWQQTAKTFDRVTNAARGAATDIEFVGTRCGAARGAVAKRPALVLKVARCTQRRAPGDIRVTAHYSSINWLTMGSMRDSLWIDIARTNGALENHRD